MELYVRVRRVCMVDGMSTREAARVFGLHRDTVRKMLAYSVPPGYRRQGSPRRPKLEPYTGIIGAILEDDLGVSPEACATPPSASSSGSRTSTGLRASTPSSRTT